MRRNADGEIRNSTIEGTGEGLGATMGGVATYFEGAIRDNVTGASDRSGGGVFLVAGAVVADSSFHGVAAYPDASVELQA